MVISKFLLCIGLLVLGIRCGQADEQKPFRESTTHKAPADFIPFETFVKQVAAAKYEDYKKSKVANEKSFIEMKQHIINMYKGVSDSKKVASFVLDSEYADCIAINEQSTKEDEDKPQPPKFSKPAPNKGGRGKGKPSRVQSPLKLGLKDQYKNSISCTEGTIPLARLTLENLTRFKTLANFFFKPPPQEISEKAPGFHSKGVKYYADARQQVKNYGGNSFINVWNPNAYFSISQHWYGTPVKERPIQSVEGGWMKNRQKFYGRDTSRLFIYFTKNGYQEGQGCYNIDCEGFRQINRNWLLGGSFSHYSTEDGEQVGFDLQWKFYHGRWWLFIRGTGDYEIIGYYRSDTFKGGRLSKSATRVGYGGEVETEDDQPGFPLMGSGRSGNEGWLKAAFHSEIFYIPRAEDGGVGEWTELVPHMGRCYAIDLENWSADKDHGTNFFFGGPQGVNC